MSESGASPTAEEFVAARWGSLARFGYMLTGDPHAAEDLVQDALISCLSRWHKLDRAGAESYVCKVMARAAWRRARRAPHARLDDSLLRCEPSNEEAAIRAADVARALARLPSDQRIVVVLRYWLDYDEATIAQTLQCRPGTVKSRSSRAYAQLRHDLSLANYPHSRPHNGGNEEGVDNVKPGISDSARRP